MEFICRRCQHITNQTPYRVTSEEGGVVLINMIVCTPCARLAKWLGLPVVKIKSAKRVAEPKSRRALPSSKQDRAQSLREAPDDEANASAVHLAKSKYPVETFLLASEHSGRRGRSQVRR
jgi:hypothetical protein